MARHHGRTRQPRPAAEDYVAALKRPTWLLTDLPVYVALSALLWVIYTYVLRGSGLSWQEQYFSALPFVLPFSLSNAAAKLARVRRSRVTAPTSEP